MPPPHLSPEKLEEARRRTDNDVAGLIEELECDPTLGPAGYNRLLTVMDWFQSSPELLVLDSSPFAAAYDSCPPSFRNYFDPQPLPDWVDPRKLARAAVLWEENTISLLFILYVASLPTCYLLHRGIPALYRTGKLANRQKLPQRLYETGLMLDAVLDDEGLRVVDDPAERQAALLKAALADTGLDGVWKLAADGQTLIRRDGASEPMAMDAAETERFLESQARLASGIPGRRYVWGRGVLAARKVRFLHGYMRHLLRHPVPGSGQAPWDETRYGAPINQEDLAFTLLTFGYVMPAGLAKLGLEWSLEDREAFLHRWRLVGELMGVEPELMTDRWEEARQLFETILGLEAGPSEQGRELTQTLLTFLEDLFPSRLQLNVLLPVQFVAHQLGPKARDVLPEDMQARLRSFRGRFCFWTIRSVLGLYFRIRRIGYRVFPGIPLIATRGLHRLGEELVRSLWSAYERRPFYLPRNLTQWRHLPGATEAFAEKLQAWRRRLFDLVILTVGLWIVGGLLLSLGLVLAVMGRWWPAALIGGLGVAACWTFGALTQWWIPKLAGQRPEPGAQPPAAPPQS